MGDTFEAGDFTLHRLRENVWEMPREGGMRVPARVLASRRLLEEIADDRTLEQLRNTTHLPGIKKYAICMPDGHQGYGFPVGGVAGIDAEDGCISPGAVGYDINCLPGDTEVSLSFGRRMPLRDLESRFETEHAVVATDDRGRVESPIRLFTDSGAKDVFEIKTATGDTVKATADHPFSTPDGMVELGDLEPGDSVFTSPFRGLPDEQPEEFVVLDETDFETENNEIVSVLHENNLLPLKSTDAAFNRLLKLSGYHTGAGSFEGSETWFYADPDALECIADDIVSLGFTPSRINERDRDQEPSNNSLSPCEPGIKVKAEGFKKLLVALGVPVGKTIKSSFTTPTYLERLTNWQRALYLSSYFGASMSVGEAADTDDLHCPTVAQNRTLSVATDGERFFEEIAGYLDDLGIETNAVERSDAPSRDGVERIRFGIESTSTNLIRFYSTVGYRYTHQKRQKAALALTYLKRKEQYVARHDRIDVGERIVDGVLTRADGGAPAMDFTSHTATTDRHTEPSVLVGQESRNHSSMDFPSFDAFCESITIRDDHTVETEIVKIESAGEVPVYDIGVEHDAHNFLAGGFVVSNCGVRMMKTNLRYDDVHGHEEELVDALFEAIPSGLGGGGVVQGDMDTVESILKRGVDWALEEGWAIESDLAHCEDEGRRSDADASVVSQKAKDRGRNQIGSLGSGNHFLEVQRVTDLFDDEVADAYGLIEDQVVVLIHCGSRGLGHQTCNDFLREIEQAHQGLLSQLPDKELAAAPAGSHLAEEYYGAMCAAINFAWVNRQLVMHRTREVFADVFGRSWEEMDMHLLYDVAHNIAKKEVHDVGDEERELYVHRKGATRAFPAGRPEVPAAYRDTGQPVIIPGSMGAGSYVLRGGDRSMSETFGSTAHGAGRLMSRTQAKREFWGGDVQDDLREGQQVYVKAHSGATIAEEAPGVYKDVDEVVRVSDALGIGDKVARTFPVCNIKG